MLELYERIVNSPTPSIMCYILFLENSDEGNQARADQDNESFGSDENLFANLPFFGDDIEMSEDEDVLIPTPPLRPPTPAQDSVDTSGGDDIIRNVDLDDIVNLQPVLPAPVLANPSGSQVSLGDVIADIQFRVAMQQPDLVFQPAIPTGPEADAPVSAAGSSGDNQPRTEPVDFNFAIPQVPAAPVFNVSPQSEMWGLAFWNPAPQSPEDMEIAAPAAAPSGLNVALNAVLSVAASIMSPAAPPAIRSTASASTSNAISGGAFQSPPVPRGAPHAICCCSCSECATSE